MAKVDMLGRGEGLWYSSHLGMVDVLWAASPLSIMCIVEPHGLLA